MPITVRISPTEVQVGRFMYTFEEPNEADGFQACVAAVNGSYCERKHPAVSKRIADSSSQGSEQVW